MATYKNYQQTNLLGLEILPSHWEVKKIKHLFSIGRGRVISQAELEDEGMYPVYSSQTHNDGCLGYINSYDFNCEQITWTTDGANAGTVFLRKGKYNCTNVCGTLQPINKENLLQFHLYCLQYINQFHKRPDTNGAKIMNNEMAEVYIPLPSNQEQLRITTFLNHETAKIDNLIEKQQQLIELLKEKRQAVISHAVTKGLNPDVPMKDSGVAWLGEIPEKWEIWKLSHAYEVIGSGTTPTSNNDKLYCGNIAWVTTGELRENIIYDTIKKIDTKTIESFPSLRLYPSGSVIIAMYGATIGRLGILGISATTNQACCVMTKSSVINNQYLFYWLQAFRSEIIQLSSGGGQPNINQEKVSSLKISAPSGDIQIQIVNYINSKIIQFDTLIDKQLQQIELLKERRTALISAAVTGKIDLRNWTAPIPEAETPTEASA